MSSQDSGGRFINPPSMPQPVGYSHIAEVKRGKIFFISDQVALDQTGKLVGEGDLHAQTQQVFANLKSALEAVDASFNDVVKLTFYFLDISQIQIVRDVRDQFVNVYHPPTSTAVEVGRLAREGFLIEIDAVAVAP